MKVKDIEGNEIKVGQIVYYARKRDFHANGQLIKVKVTSMQEHESYRGVYVHVKMGKYVSTDPSTQILVKE